MTTPKKVKRMTFNDLLAETERREKEHAAKLAAMTPAERIKYEEARQRSQAEVEALLEKLRGPGFTEFRAPGE